MSQEQLSKILVRFQRAMADVEFQGAVLYDARKKAKLEKALSNKEDALRALNTSLQLKDLNYAQCCIRVIAFDQTEDGIARLQAKV